MKVNEIYNMDCLDGLLKIEDNSVDLVVTSPPYNIDIKYDSYDDNKSWEEYLEWCEKWIKECYRILKDDGRMCINHYISFTDTKKKERFPLYDFITIQNKIGMHPSKIVVWEDTTKSKLTAWGSWLSASSPYIQTPYEGILISYKKQWSKINKGESTISKEDFIEGTSGVWKLGTAQQLTIANFPVALPKRCIELLTYKGDLVVDPFMGSGTTALACIETERNFIGFELSKNYCEIANIRIGKDKSTLW